MADNGRGCLGQTLLGCGAVILLAIGLAVVLTVAVMRPFSDAADDHETLDARYGDRSEWSPSADGSVPQQRIEAFLDVRRAVHPLCDDFTAAEEQIASMQRFDEQQEVSRSEVLREALATTRHALGLGPLTGELFAARNAALVDAGMGLGEYAWIYTLAYHDRLREVSDPDMKLFGGSQTDRRVLADVRTMLERQLETSEDPAMRAALESEIEAMRSDPERVPWPDGLPDPIADSFARYRETLDALYCEASAPVELLTTTRRGLAITAE